MEQRAQDMESASPSYPSICSVDALSPVPPPQFEMVPHRCILPFDDATWHTSAGRNESLEFHELASLSEELNHLARE